MRRVLLLLLLAATFILISSSAAFAGQASTGDLLFYPCTTCHPVDPAAPASGRKLPNGFKEHDVVLVGHDILGKGDAACIVCHDDPRKNPGLLKTVDGSLVDIRGDVSLVCEKCHSAKYAEWKAGIHGKSQPECTSAGCHDPHSPGWIYAKQSLPFAGTGFQFRVRPAKQEFTPLASPAPRGVPPVETPVWFVVVAAATLIVGGSLVGALIAGRSKR